jgi:ribosomal protein S12
LHVQNHSVRQYICSNKYTSIAKEPNVLILFKVGDRLSLESRTIIIFAPDKGEKTTAAA